MSTFSLMNKSSSTLDTLLNTLYNKTILNHKTITEENNPNWRLFLSRRRDTYVSTEKPPFIKRLINCQSFSH